jgi:hypothetical protein
MLTSCIAVSLHFGAQNQKEPEVRLIQIGTSIDLFPSEFSTRTTPRPKLRSTASPRHTAPPFKTASSREQHKLFKRSRPNVGGSQGIRHRQQSLAGDGGRTVVTAEGDD